MGTNTRHETVVRSTLMVEADRVELAERLDTALEMAMEVGYPVQLIPLWCEFFRAGSNGIIVAEDEADLKHKFDWVKTMSRVGQVILKGYER